MIVEPDQLPAGSESEPVTAPVGPPPPEAGGPIAQAVVLGFRALYIASAVLVFFWILSGVRIISSDSQVVVRRFGRIVRAQQNGLLVTWPRPIEQVQVLPGPQRQLTQEVSGLLAPTDMFRTVIEGPAQEKNSRTAAVPREGVFLTGDSNILLLNSSLIYRIDDPIAYALEEEHVAPALDRLFRTSAVHIAAGRNLNDFLVVQTKDDQSGKGQNLVALRSEVRESLIRTMNDRLHALESAGAGLGVEIEQINLTPSLTPGAKQAFNQVLVAGQAADRGVAVARTDAERIRQQANSQAEQITSAAEATAKETVTKASVDTATILALVHDERTFQNRDILLLREYRARVADIMNRAGRVTLVDPKSGARVVLPGVQP